MDSLTPNKSQTRCLILIGGICAQAYIRTDVTRSGYDISAYDQVIEFDYEAYLDSRLSWIPFYQWMKRLDKHGDWLQFALDAGMRSLIRLQLSILVSRLSQTHTHIDIMAHSLGTWIAMGTMISVQNVLLIGSPLSSISSLISWRVIDELQRPHLRADSLTYLWNAHDPVCTQPPSRDILAQISDDYHILERGHGHGLVDYLQAYMRG